VTDDERDDPHLRTRFIVEIEGLVVAGFSGCRLPTARSPVVEYREGTDLPTARKLPGLNEYGPLVLETGVTDRSAELAGWRTLVEQGRMTEARRPVAVTLLDAAGHGAARWEFSAAWPSAYEAPRLDATASAVAIERLVVVHEGFERMVEDDDDDEDGVDNPVVNPPKGGVPRSGKPQGIDESRRASMLDADEAESDEA
jgi:phage tail-like protein